MKTNKLIIYAAIGVGLWLLFQKKGVSDPVQVKGFDPVFVDGQWMYSPQVWSGDNRPLHTYEEAKYLSENLMY